MASSSAQGLIQSDRLVNRRYVRIPHDQNELLKRPDAWSDQLRAGPSGMLNVPDYVLEDVKKSYIRKCKEGTPTSSRMPLGTAGAERPQQPIAPLDTNDDDEDALSWSSSGAEDAGDSEEELTKEKVLEIQTTPKFPARHPSKSPRRLPRKDSRFQLPADLPSSSLANSDDLEIEPPSFLSQEIGVPVNREPLRPTASTRPEPTPPSAQMPIATVASTMQAAPAYREQRMTKEPAGTSYDDIARETAIAALGLSKWGCIDLNDHHRSSTTTTTTTSLPPRSGLQSPSGKTTPLNPPAYFAQPVDSKTKSSDLPPTWEGRPKRSASSPLMNPDDLVPTSGSVPPNAQPIPREAPPKLKPYEEFKAAYPDYSESARAFVSGCLNVKQIMRDRTLAEFLYDDFIRAFSTDYMIYISKCNRKKVKSILPAVEWYNEMTKDPKYLKKIIRKNNLVAILEAHADDVAGIRRSLGDSQSTESGSEIEDNDEEMLDASVENEDKVEATNVEEAHNSQPSPESHAKLPVTRRSQKAAQQGRNNSPTRRAESLATMDAPTASNRANVRPESDPVEACEIQPKVAAKQATRPPSSPATHLKTPSGKTTDAQGQPDSSQPTAHSTPATTRKAQHSPERTVSSSSGGSFTTMTPVKRSRPRPPSSKEGPGDNTANYGSSNPVQNHKVEQQQIQKQHAPKVSSPLRKSIAINLPSKRPFGTHDEDDDEDDDAFDPPVNDLMPRPPKRPAHHLEGLQKSQTPVYEPIATTPPARRAGQSFPSTMPATTTAANQGPTSRPHRQGTTVSSSRPSASAAVSEGGQIGRSTSLFPETRTTNRVTKRISETRADRAKNFKEFLKRRSLGSGTPSSTLKGSK